MPGTPQGFGAGAEEMLEDAAVALVAGFGIGKGGIAF